MFLKRNAHSHDFHLFVDYMLIVHNLQSNAFRLILAKHVITEKSNIQEATALLRESSVLHLEDVFPLFPDFVTIDQFRVSCSFCQCSTQYIWFS